MAFNKHTLRGETRAPFAIPRKRALASGNVSVKPRVKIFFALNSARRRNTEIGIHRAFANCTASSSVNTLMALRIFLPRSVPWAIPISHASPLQTTSIVTG